MLFQAAQFEAEEKTTRSVQSSSLVAYNKSGARRLLALPPPPSSLPPVPTSLAVLAVVMVRANLHILQLEGIQYCILNVFLVFTFFGCILDTFLAVACRKSRVNNCDRS